MMIVVPALYALLASANAAVDWSLSNKDIFMDFIKTYADPTIHPCDNFYRHVCPINVPQEHTVGRAAELYMQQLVQKGLPKMPELFQFVQPSFDATAFTPNYRDAVADAIDGLAAIRNMFLRGHILATSPDDLAAAVSTAKLKQLEEALRTRIRSDLSQFAFRSAEVRTRWQFYLEHVSLSLGFNDDTKAIGAELKEAANVAAIDYAEYMTAKRRSPILTQADYESRVDEFVYVYEEHAKEVLDVLTAAQRAMYTDDDLKYLPLVFGAGNSAVVTGTVLSVLLKNSDQDQFWRGVAGPQIAAALLSSVFNEFSNQTIFYLDGAENNYRDCMKRYMLISCLLFREDCNCYRLTNAPLAVSTCDFIDKNVGKHLSIIEGLKYASDEFFKATTLPQEKPSADALTKVEPTPRQMFYYAHAVAHCFEYAKGLMEVSSGKYSDVGVPIIMNAAYAADKNFQKTFGCPDRDKMSQAGRCDYLKPAAP